MVGGWRLRRGRWQVPVVIGMLVVVAAAGCTPRVLVTPHPGPRTKGIRYYRPKPYLKVVPAEVQLGKDKTSVEPSLVSITLEYLPDFSEEYAIDVRSGFGVAEVAIKLEDGWNLTEINQQLDSQTDENLSAMADVIRAVGSTIPTAGGDGEKPLQITAAASEVPLGYYESVIGCGSDGKKRLYGFRYVGFLPYQMCPVSMGGSEYACCGDPAAPLYGLTFENGRMVFKNLQQLQHPVATASSGTPATGPLASPTSGAEVSIADLPTQAELASRVEQELLTTLRAVDPLVTRVEARLDNAAGTLAVAVVCASTPEPARRARIGSAAERALGELLAGRIPFSVAVGEE